MELHMQVCLAKSKNTKTNTNRAVCAHCAGALVRVEGQNGEAQAFLGITRRHVIGNGPILRPPRVIWARADRPRGPGRPIRDGGGALQHEKRTTASGTTVKARSGPNSAPRDRKWFIRETTTGNMGAFRSPSRARSTHT